MIGEFFFFVLCFVKQTIFIPAYRNCMCLFSHRCFEISLRSLLRQRTVTTASDLLSHVAYSLIENSLICLRFPYQNVFFKKLFLFPTFSGDFPINFPVEIFRHFPTILTQGHLPIQPIHKCVNLLKTQLISKNVYVESDTESVSCFLQTKSVLITTHDRC